MLRNKKYLYAERNTLIPSRINFGEYILSKMRLYKNDVVINGSTNESITYGEIAQQAMNLAISLYQLGVRKGDVVAIVSENRYEYLSTVIGVACVGAINTLISPLYKEEEIKHAMNISKPTYIFCSESAYKAHVTFFKTLEDVMIILYGSEKIDDCIFFNDLVIPTDDENEQAKANDVKDEENHVKNEENNVKDEKFNVKNENDVRKFKRLKTNVNYEDFEVVDVVGQTDTLFLFYSSGTTGLAKGVQLTHLNFLAYSCCIPTELISICFYVTPWFHVYGLLAVLVNLTKGQAIMYMTKFEINLYLEIIERYRVKMLIIIPAILVAILKCTKQYDLSSVISIVSGAAPLDADVIRSILTK